MKPSTNKMIKDWAIAIGVAFTVMFTFSLCNQGPTLTGDAPAFSGTTLAGDAVTLDSLQGQPVVLNFWATWCGPCRREIPALSAFHLAHPEVALIGISLDSGMSESTLRSKSSALGINYPVIYDQYSDIGQDYGVSSLPTTVVIGTDGTILNVWQGAISERSLRRLLDL